MTKLFPTNSLKPFVVSGKAVRISVKARGTLVSLKRRNGGALNSRGCNGLTIFSILSKQGCGLNQACNHLVYLSEKFRALNQRINEIRSSENQQWPLPQVLTLRFVKPLRVTLWLSDLAAMLPRAS